MFNLSSDSSSSDSEDEMQQKTTIRARTKRTKLQITPPRYTCNGDYAFASVLATPSLMFRLDYYNRYQPLPLPEAKLTVDSTGEQIRCFTIAALSQCLLGQFDPEKAGHQDLARVLFENTLQSERCGLLLKVLTIGFGVTAHKRRRWILESLIESSVQNKSSYVFRAFLQHYVEYVTFIGTYLEYPNMIRLFGECFGKLHIETMGLLLDMFINLPVMNTVIEHELGLFAKRFFTQLYPDKILAGFSVPNQERLVKLAKISPRVKQLVCFHESIDMFIEERLLREKHGDDYEKVLLIDYSLKTLCKTDEERRDLAKQYIDAKIAVDYVKSLGF